MFRSLDPSASTGPQRPQRLWRRVLLFSLGLVFLWVALQLMPTRTPGPPPPAFSTESEDVAASTVQPTTPLPERTSLFSTGYVAVVLLLIGGVGVAFYLRRRTQGHTIAATSLQSLGQLQFAPNQQVRLIRCGEDVLLLGVTSGQITLLKNYSHDAFTASDDTPEPPVKEVLPQIEAAPDKTAFSHVLRYYAGRARNEQQIGTS